jgi:hypothetical protein
VDVADNGAFQLTARNGRVDVRGIDGSRRRVSPRLVNRVSERRGYVHRRITGNPVV